jgi:hypothetical protein
MKGVKRPLVAYFVKQIGPPYNLELKLRDAVEAGVPMNLAFSCWTVDDKKISNSTLSGETLMLGENSITALIEPPLIPFTDIKLVFDFCVDAHCFGDIYAKVLSVEEKAGKTVHQLQITAIDQKDRDILDRWMKDAS